MKLKFFILSLAVLAFSACAHNPRPETPEQRAERHAHSLQEQQNARTEPQSIRSPEDEQVAARQRDDAPEPTAQPVHDPASDSGENLRTTTRTVVAPTRPVAMPVYTGVTGTVRGLFR